MPGWQREAYCTACAIAVAAHGVCPAAPGCAWAHGALCVVIKPRGGVAADADAAEEIWLRSQAVAYAISAKEQATKEQVTRMGPVAQVVPLRPVAQVVPLRP